MHPTDVISRRADRPGRPLHPPRSSAAATARPVARPAQAAAVAPQRQPARILVVDDDDVTRMAISAGLQRLGYQTAEADCALAALERAADWQPDFAIIDITMPGMSGIELAARLRELGELPFMFLSSHDGPDVVRAASAHAAVAYLVKPLGVAQIIPAIEVGLVRSAELAALREKQTVLSQALSDARDTNLAIGVLMERHGLEREQAFDILRGQARAQRRKVNAVAAEVLAVGGSDAMQGR
ncbi:MULTISPECIES: ANTAR domain-containing response regulator [unclassified Duganella]|uniref:ANTAR domain-containing response regulator n=1 Tax=unclassified Duganella TaxID=2636909 RepID=UPI0013147C4A|nr:MULTISPECIES: response regulator [unclassified Duganella]